MAFFVLSSHIHKDTCSTISIESILNVYIYIFFYVYIKYHISYIIYLY